MKLILNNLLYLLLLVIVCIACTKQNTSQGNADPSTPQTSLTPTPTPEPSPSATPIADFTKLTPTCFQASNTNPIYTNGSFIGSFAKWNDPSIIKVNNEYIFNAWLIGEPGAVVFNNQIYLYFTANGYHTNITPNNPLQVIGLIKSSNGIAWSSAQEVLAPDGILFPRLDGSNNDLWVAYSTPNAIVLDNQLHLFYDVASNISNAWAQRRLHHSKSTNGETGWTQDSSVIFSNSDFSWTSHEIRAPSLLFDGIQLLMWFAGDDGAGNLGLGLSTCNL